MTFGVKEVKARYGVSEGTVLAWIKFKELKAIDVAPRKGGRPHWRVTEEALKQFETLRGTTPPTPAPVKARRQKQDASGPY